MKARTKVLRWCAVVLPCQITIAAGAHAGAPAGGGEVNLPPQYALTGIVRDFRQGHVDFDVVPQGGYGHYAGNVALELGEDGRPVFVGGGFRVEEEWRNSAYQPIAPHVAAGDPQTVKVTIAPAVGAGAIVDTWDSSEGPYGGGNVGPPPTFLVGAAMLQLSAPSGIGPNLGDLDEWPAGVSTIDEDLHCDRFVVGERQTIQIVGDVTIWAEEEFKLLSHAVLQVLPGAVLRLYTGGTVVLGGSSSANVDTAEPARLKLFNLGTADVLMHAGAGFCGQLQSPDGRLVLFPGAGFSGAFAGKTVWAAGGSGFHVDVAPPRDACGNAIVDVPGAGGSASSGGIESTESFSEWYRDVPGANLSTLHSITLTYDDEFGYGYLDEHFYPIDHQLFGNEGQLHNTLFTFALEATFVYQACAGQFIGFEGSDDLWVFVDGGLAMDAGGVLPGTEQFIELDRLGLVDGQIYPISLFFAQRQTVRSEFQIKTNIVFQQDHVIATLTAPFD
jgi:fibro-slime domain-containing protein